MSGRGSTRTGRSSALPGGHYDPPPLVISAETTTAVKFHGEDGRQFEYRIDRFPLSDWHQPLASAWATRIGPSGGLRTLSSTKHAWGILGRFMRFLDEMPWPPRTPSSLMPQHIDSYYRQLAQRTNRRRAGIELRSLSLIFALAPLRELIPSTTLDRMKVKVFGSGLQQGTSGYSDAEFSQILAAARTDIRALQQRLEAPPDAEAVTTLQTGRVAIPAASAPKYMRSRREIAQKVFATRADLYPMLVLLIATTGWNLEVMKELPAEYRLIEGKAVELDLVKRRRGSRNWHHTVTWEIGPVGRELSTPGGVYLLLHRLMEPARKHLDKPGFWAIWHSYPIGGNSEPECRNPFEKRLDASLRWSSWTQSHGLRVDPHSADGAVEPRPLRLSGNRLKTSVDVRRTRQYGGHLPSAARSNTTAVLFSNYLAGDKTTIDWAHEVVSEAFTDVQRAAYDAHRRALQESGRLELNILTISSVEYDNGHGSESGAKITSGDVAPATPTAWASCADHDHHPLTGKRCQTSFLDCFHCANSVITGDHLPRVLSLLDSLELRRSHLSESDWWTRYGSVWMAIREDVLPKFSEQEVTRALGQRPADSLLDIVEPRWERP